MKKEITPPFKPQVSSKYDLKYFSKVEFQISDTESRNKGKKQ